MNILMILPALTEAKSPFWRPIKYSLFPPLGLATLAAYADAERDEIRIVDEHVEPEIDLGQPPSRVPDLVVIQVYITNAFRSYRLADYFRRHGAFVVLGGLHITSLPDEALPHADAICLGPGEETFPRFLRDFRAGAAARVYDSRDHPRDLARIPPIRRDLIQRRLYLVPNSIVVSRGCPHHCNFCYKDAFFSGGRSFYVQQVDAALAEIERLPGRHLYFLDDHLLGHTRFARNLFEGMKGMNRVFQGAATVDSVLRGDLIEHAAAAGLRSLFVGFETIDPATLTNANKKQNLGRDYDAVIRRLDELGIMINGSFVFGLDGDRPDVFERTVEWAVSRGITTATFHIATPYPGTEFHRRMVAADRILHHRWDLYDTRHVVFRPQGMTAAQLEAGYWRAYRDFYAWKNILRASTAHARTKHRVKHLAYAVGWKKCERMWNLLITSKRLRIMRPLLEAVLSKVKRAHSGPTDPRPDAPPRKTPERSVALPVLSMMLANRPEGKCLSLDGPAPDDFKIDPHEALKGEIGAETIDPRIDRPAAWITESHAP